MTQLLIFSRSEHAAAAHPIEHDTRLNSIDLDNHSRWSTKRLLNNFMMGQLMRFHFDGGDWIILFYCSHATMDGLEFGSGAAVTGFGNMNGFVASGV